jgi:hypothetical protein
MKGGTDNLKVSEKNCLCKNFSQVNEETKINTRTAGSYLDQTNLPTACAWQNKGTFFLIHNQAQYLEDL